MIDFSQLLYKPGKITTPFHKTPIPVIFADDTASGRPCKLVERYITEEIYPYYSNTHSNAYCGIKMKNMIKDVRNVIRTLFNVPQEQNILFTGNGCTGAINHLVNSIDPKLFNKVKIFVSPLEHHSNFLPWKELSNEYENITFEFLKLNMKTLIDYDYLQDKIKDTNNNDLIIISIIGCSNVTGERTNIKDIYKLKQKYNRYNNIFLLIDYACSAPYDLIDGNLSDGFFFSGHKFLGGPGTPGVLVANNKLFEKSKPYNPGGGCVVKADDKCVIYKEDIESRETGGTPNIVGIIKLGYCIKLKHALLDDIKNNEIKINNYVEKRLKDLSNKYNKFKLLNVTKSKKDCLPIFSIAIEGLHYNFIVVLFNDLFGIQTRGGLSCCGVLGRIFNEKYGVNGWCRISFNYMMDQNNVNYILESLETIIQNGEKLLDKYDYNPQTNLFKYKE